MCPKYKQDMLNNKNYAILGASINSIATFYLKMVVNIQVGTVMKFLRL